MIQDKDRPLFSVVVPIYNTEQYLEQCVQTIIGQTFSDFEVILVDDGSPDRCGEICDVLAQTDSRIAVIHKSNGGLVSARKAGAAACSGRYVVSVDSDDYIACDLLEKLAAVIEKYQPQAVLFDLVQFYESKQSPLCKKMQPGLYEGEKMKEIRNNLIQNDACEQVLLYNLASMAVLREKYLPYQMAVPDTISRGEDLVVTAPYLASCENVYLLEYGGYFYRRNPQSIMNTFKTNEMDQNKQVAQYLLSALGIEYEAKVSVYVLAHFFDFLDRAMLCGSYGEYRKIIAASLDEDVSRYIRKAKHRGSAKLKLIYGLIKCRCFTALWLLRKIKGRC